MSSIRRKRNIQKIENEFTSQQLEEALFDSTLQVIVFLKRYPDDEARIPPEDGESGNDDEDSSSSSSSDSS